MLNLTFQLLRLLADGTLTATSVQLLAAAAKADGWGVGDETALKLAGIGAGGNQPNNCLRDLIRLSQKLGIADANPSRTMRRSLGQRSNFAMWACACPTSKPT